MAGAQTNFVLWSKSLGPRRLLILAVAAGGARRAGAAGLRAVTGRGLADEGATVSSGATETAGLGHDTVLFNALYWLLEYPYPGRSNTVLCISYHTIIILSSTFLHQFLPITIGCPKNSKKWLKMGPVTHIFPCEKGWFLLY